MPPRAAGNRGQNPARGAQGGGRGDRGRGRGRGRGGGAQAGGRGGGPAPAPAPSPSPTLGRGGDQASDRGGGPAPGPGRGGGQAGDRGGGPAPNRGRGGDQAGDRGRGGRGRGGGPGPGRGRGQPAIRGGIPAAGRDIRPSIAENVKAVGVKRTQVGCGTAGRLIKVRMNSFETNVPDDILCQYDATTPDDLSKRFKLRMLDKVQADEPNLFTSPVLYDGRAIMFSKQRLSLGDTDSREFNVVVDVATPGRRPPKVYKMKITKVDMEVNLHTLQEFVAGRYTQDNTIQMAEMALNIAIRMLSRKKYPSNARSFYIPDGKSPLGAGAEVWRGYHQSIRPSIGRLILNVDISSAAMYRPGPLIDVCLDFFGFANVNQLQRMTETQKRKLGSFLKMVKIKTNHAGKERTDTIQKLVYQAASAIRFDHEDYGNITIAAYFQRNFNRPLRQANLPVCVQVGKRSILPLEMCEVIPGQFCQAELTPDQTKNMVEFATKRPDLRFASIREGLPLLDHVNSEYTREFGITVDQEFVEVDARILQPPRLKCFPDRDPKRSTIIPGNGQWNMLNKKYYNAAKISGFMVIIFENERFFGEPIYKEVVKGFVNAARDFGVTIEDPVPYVKWVVGRPDVNQLLLDAGRAYIDQKSKQTGKKEGPSLILAVLPPSSQDLYNGVKRFGYIRMGVATQCLLSSKCRRANHQYWANIMLKVNAKLGGVNFVPELAMTSDPTKPTIIMGADAIHPPPGSTSDKPSFTALVSSVDSMCSKYVASNGMQPGREEMIAELQPMCKNALTKWKSYQGEVEKKRNPPTRLIYFRDGVSEGEFEQVLTQELPKIKDACKEVGFNPKITVIVVGKRHHHRGMPVNPGDADKSGNIPAGTTIDTGITHPVESDYYQYTHGGLLGTSRPAHYIPLYDENGMTADSIQALSFGLAHSFARATRSVSIPAPVYYADIVCAKRAIHFNPAHNLGSDTASQASGARPLTLQSYRDAWSSIHERQSGVMYWM